MKKNYLKLNPKKVSKKEAKQLFILFLAKLGFNKMSPTDKVSKARQIVTAMTGNANFPTPTPPLASVTTAADALEAAQQAINGEEINTVLRDEAEAELETLMSGLQGYVDAASLKDTAKILSAGFEVRDARTAVGLLGPVESVTAKLGIFPATIDLKWKPIKRSKLFIVEYRMNNGPINAWEFGGETTKSKITIEGLQSNVVYDFKITCVSTAGPGPSSEIVTIKAY
jgi:hypothetical protein